MKRQTISGWKKINETNPEWRPSRKNYSLSKQIIPTHFEELISKKLKTNYIKKNIVLTKLNTINTIKHYLAEYVKKGDLNESILEHSYVLNG